MNRGRPLGEKVRFRIATRLKYLAVWTDDGRVSPLKRLDPVPSILQRWKRGAGSIAGAARPNVKSVLLDPGATTLDQYDQHNHSQHARDNLDDRGRVHVKISLLFVI
jgi:hypothetical protein